METVEKDRSEEVQESAGVGCSVGEGDCEAYGEELVKIPAMIEGREEYTDGCTRDDQA